MKNKKFDLEDRYQQYLKTVGLKESAMMPIQRTEMKRTFMGACGVMLVVLKEDVAALPEDEAIKRLEEMFDQVGNYFMKETNKLN